MNFSVLFLFILAFTDALEGAPYPRPIEGEKGELSPLDILKSLPWRALLAPVGTLGVIGAVVGIVALGRKADVSYIQHQKDLHANGWHEFNRLPAKEREYLRNRFANGAPGDKEWEDRDAALGYPTGKTPDTSGMDPKSRRKVEKAWKHHEKQVEAVEDLKRLRADLHQDNEKKRKLFTVTAARVNKIREAAIENMSKKDNSETGSQIGSSELP